MAKSKFLNIRISEEEKKEIHDAARDSGFDSASTFLLWFWRKHKHLARPRESK